MSRESVVAKRYAKALYEVSEQMNIVSDVENELKLIVQAIDSDQEVKKFLGLPNIDTSKKIELLKGALSGKVSQPVLNTVELLVARGRQSALADVSEAFTKIAGEAQGQANATVYTAIPLNETEMSKVVAQFGALVGKKIRAEQIVEPALLGGIQVRIGDRLYDGSLSGKLARMEKSLKSHVM